MARITGEDILKIALANPDVIVPLQALEAGKAKAGKSKYNAVRCEFMGIKFASKAEMRRYGELRLLELSGQITGLEVQPKIELAAGVRYIGDFRYTENEQEIIEDTKGVRTQLFNLKWKQAKERYPTIKFIITGENK